MGETEKQLGDWQSRHAQRLAAGKKIKKKKKKKKSGWSQGRMWWNNMTIPQYWGLKTRPLARKKEGMSRLERVSG